MAPEKVTIYRRHIPHQVEIDRALSELRSKVIRQFVVNFETTDLIREYDRSARFKDIYSCMNTYNLKTKQTKLLTTCLFHGHRLLLNSLKLTKT